MEGMDRVYVLLALYLVLTALSSKMLFEVGKREINSRVLEVAGVFVVVAFSLLIVGMRDGNSAGDTPQYLYVFDNLRTLNTSWLDGFQLYGNTELLFWPTAYVFKALGFSAEVWMGMVVVVTTMLVGYGYKNLGLGRLWYIPFSGLYLTYYIVFMAAIRQSIAESLVLLALVFVRRNNIIASIVILLIAAGYHSSALLGFSLIFLNRFSINPRIITVSILVAVVASVLAPSVLAAVFEVLGFENTLGKVMMYSAVDGGNEFGNLFHHKQFLLLLFVVISYLSILRGSDDIVYKFIFFLVFTLFFFWSMPVMSGRVMGYLTLLLPYMLIKITQEFLSESNSMIFSWFVFSIMGLLVLNTNSTKLVLGLF